jgi:PEP-CTERM motif
MDSRRTRFNRITLAAQLALALGSTLVASQALATTVTTTDLHGWALFDGGNGTSPATITGAQPDAGNGSLQLTISAGGQQPAAALLFGSPITFSQLVDSDMSLSYDWLVPVGSPTNTSATIRLLLSGLSGVSQPANRTDGSLGFYVNTLGDGTFHTSSLSMTSGDFFFRVGGVGQEAAASPNSVGCSSTTTTFDDRRQTLAAWAANCNGAGGTANIDNAQVIGIEVDFGTLPGNTTTQSVFADLINFNIGSNVGAFNFETAATGAVPEPESLALMLLGLGLVGATVRGKRGRRAVA